MSKIASVTIEDIYFTLISNEKATIIDALDVKTHNRYRGKASPHTQIGCLANDKIAEICYDGLCMYPCAGCKLLITRYDDDTINLRFDVNKYLAFTVTAHLHRIDVDKLYMDKLQCNMDAIQDIVQQDNTKTLEKIQQEIDTMVGAGRVIVKFMKK